MRDEAQIKIAEEEFEEIVRHYGTFLRSVIARTCPRDLGLQISDIEQEACIRLWRAIQSERKFTDPASYIYRIAVTTTIDAVRRVIARREQQLELELDSPSESEPDRLHSADSPERIAQQRQFAAAVDAALARLARNRRGAVELYLQGMSSQEIADLMDWSEPKARNLMYRGLSDLRKLLKAEGIEYET